MAITTVILGTTMAAMNDAVKATDSAKQVTELNNGLRTAMDMMTRDMHAGRPGAAAGPRHRSAERHELGADAAARPN